MTRFGRRDDRDGRVVLTTGCSSGIGLATSLTVSRNGFKVYSTMRDLKKSRYLKEVVKKENLPVEILKLDVRDKRNIKNVVRSIIKREGRIDALINNAGYGLYGAFEDVDDSQIREQFETNLFAVMRLTREVIPHMRESKGGTIINISSISGRIAYPLFGPYCSSKFALEGFSESIRHELKKFDIDVVLVEPGLVDTDFAKSLVISKKVGKESLYNNEYKIAEREHDKDATKALTPEEVAKIILKILNTRNPRLRYGVGAESKMLSLAKRALPDSFLETLIRKGII